MASPVEADESECLTNPRIHAKRPICVPTSGTGRTSIMYDIRKIAGDPEGFDRALERRGIAPHAAVLLKIDQRRREAITLTENMRAERNRASRSAGEARAQGDQEAFERHRDAAARLREEIAGHEEERQRAETELRDLLLGFPNSPDDDVPDGSDEADNVEIRRWGKPRDFSFAPKEHHELECCQGGMDFELAARLSGARFVVLNGAVARIHRALGQFMLDRHTTRNGYTETNPPVLVLESAMIGTGQLPKFADDSYRTDDGHWLVPTSEVSMTNYVADQIVDRERLPMRLTAHTLCFRSEAGAAGRDTAGMLRQHQFEKVEMVSITRPEDSRAELDRMTACAEDILETLELPYRTVILCAGDMGFGASRTHDIEVWLPGQNCYREISSCSVCDDFQARRMNARFRPAPEASPEFLHTLNGSGLAIGRCLIAVLENGQQEDGSVRLPAVLRDWLGGCSTLTADGQLV